MVGVDGSETSRHALRFAIDLAALHHAPLQVMFCWQLKDLGVIEGYENAIAPIAVGQERAERILDELLDSVEIPTAGIPRRFPDRIARLPYFRCEGADRGIPLRTPSSGRFPWIVRLGRAFPWFRLQANRQFRRLHRHCRALNL